MIKEAMAMNKIHDRSLRVLILLLIGFCFLVFVGRYVNAEEKYQFERMWPNSNWNFSWIRGIALDKSGNLYVLDNIDITLKDYSGDALSTESSSGGHNSRILKYNPNGVLITKWVSEGDAVGIAIDSDNNIYVSSGNFPYIQKFTSEGTLIKKWEYGKYEGIAPSFGVDMSIDSDDNVYIADTYNHCVRKYTSNGEFILRWGRLGENDGEFLGSLGIAIDKSNNIYILEKDNARIQKFNAEGRFITKWGRTGLGKGEFIRPSCITVDNSGFLYILDGFRIQKFAADGNFILEWKPAIQFYDTRFIAVNTIGKIGKIYMADVESIRKYTFDGELVSTWNGQNEFASPNDVATDFIGNIFILDDRDGTVLWKLTAEGILLPVVEEYDGSIDGPFDTKKIAIDFSGNLYMVQHYLTRIDFWTRVIKVNDKGNITLLWSSGKEDFEVPLDIVVDHQGNIFMGLYDKRDNDPGYYYIKEFNSEMKLIGTWEKLDCTKRNVVKITDIAASLDSIYITDAINHRILKFSNSGKLETKWGKEGDGDGDFKHPVSIAVDLTGNVFVLDSGNCRVQKFNSTGKFVTKWGRPGVNEGEFRAPASITVDKSGNVYIADTGNYRVQKFVPVKNEVGK